MESRRAFLAGALAAPAVLKGAKTSRSITEIEKLIARGDVRGKLTRDELPTPALLVDLDGLEGNIAKMAAHAKSAGRALRPHAKTHKCGEIAKMLIRAGAVGACAAKISEAEALAAEGVNGLLLTSSMIGKLRIERAIRLAKQRPDTIFSMDNAQNVKDMNDAAAAAKLKLNVAIDLLVSGRTGIQPGEPALGLAQLIASQANLKLKGIQAYAGQASHTVGFEKRTEVSREAMGRAVETRRLIEKSGIECNWLSGGSTGTYNIDTNIEGITEIQPGSFLFMDVDYNRIGGSGGDAVYRDFRNSLTVLATVISKPSDSSAIVDAGYKSFSTDRPFGPEAKSLKVPYSWAGDEHGRLNLAQASGQVNLGDRLEFIIPHCDPTVNLYDRMYAMRAEDVEAVWRVSARGMSQ
jgi:D-serine deaminase-like pyridoxal phosphate-dependent protein